MSDLPFTPEDYEALRVERDRLVQERDAAHRRAETEIRRADGLNVTVARRDAETQVNALALQAQQADVTLAGVTEEIERLQRLQSDFWAEGKFEEASAVSVKIGVAAARQVRASENKAYFEQQREAIAKQPADPVDRFFSVNQQYTETERAWIRQNPRYATDADFRDRVHRAHAEIKDAIEPQSREYFEKLEAAGYMRPAPRVEPAPRAAAPAVDPDPDDPYSEAAAEADPVTQENQPVEPRRPPARSVAAAPSRRAPASPRRQEGGVSNLTPDQAATALAMSDYAPPEVLEQGEAGIYKWWDQLNRSPMAQRLRADWSSTPVQG